MVSLVAIIIKLPDRFSYTTAVEGHEKEEAEKLGATLVEVCGTLNANATEVAREKVKQLNAEAYNR